MTGFCFETIFHLLSCVIPACAGMTKNQDTGSQVRLGMTHVIQTLALEP